MKVSLTERIYRKASVLYRDVQARMHGYMATQFLGMPVRYARGSSIPCGVFSLPRHSHRNRLVRDADFIQQLALAAYLESSKHCKLFVDVGAYHGYYAIAVGKHLAATGGRVIAIEPDRDSFDLLERSVCLNELEQTVTCLNLGCSDHCGSYYFEPGRSQGVLSSKPGASSQKVEVKTLDMILDELGINDSIDCLMIDVEGAELPVLRGLKAEYRRNAKMFVEMHPYAWNDFDYTADDFDRYLMDQGLCCIDMFHQKYARFSDASWHPGYIGPTVLMEHPA